MYQPITLYRVVVTQFYFGSICVGMNYLFSFQVVPPEKLPNKIEAIPHQEGEFPVQFLGSGEYSWMNHGRAFLYEEGDSEKARF